MWQVFWEEDLVSFCPATDWLMREEWASWGLRLCLGAGKCKGHERKDSVSRQVSPTLL